jgi:DNA polymerase alpha subunit A
MDFDEEMTEETVAKDEEVKVEDSANRGFVAAALESGGLGAGQWVSSGGRAQVREEEVAVDSSSLPTVTVEEDGEQKEVLRMYWLDAHEDPYKNPGTVWLFGKVAVQSVFVSCCVTVKNVPRRVYLAMRETNSKTGEPVTGMDLYNEFNTKVAKRYKINDFKCRPVEKSYAFEHTDLPNHGTYLEVVYGSQFPALPADLTGDTFSRLLGSPQAALEMLLLHQRVKGPGWLDIHSAVPVAAQVTTTSRLDTCTFWTLGQTGKKTLPDRL